MSLYALGLNHQTAPLAIRERVVFHVERLREALAEITRDLAREAAILSTCNRTELYVAGDDAAARAPQLSEWLARYHRFEPDGLRPYLYTLPSEQAVRHVFRVASGLDSMVLGEPQILGQMKEAARAAESAGTLGTLLHKLFQRSFVVSCTASSLPILGKGLVERALRARRRRPIFMVDLAVPRDIEPEAAELDDVFLYSIDDLAQVVSVNIDARRSAVAQAEVIIDTQV